MKPLQFITASVQPSLYDYHIVQVTTSDRGDVIMITISTCSNQQSTNKKQELCCYLVLRKLAKTNLFTDRK